MKVTKWIGVVAVALVSGCEPCVDGGTGAGGSTAPPPCEEAACARAGAECGLVYADCDEDGAPEAITCGACSGEEVCTGSGSPGLCGADCATTAELREACTAAGLPHYWAFPAWCPYTFVSDGMGTIVEACTDCGPAHGCAMLPSAAPEDVLCCPH